MEVFVADWLNLLIRWAHMIAGIGWIGTSFYFVALDMSLKKREGMPDGVLGTAWEVHGGGFYHVQKYMVAPAELPKDLIWFKWEAYLTWFTGILLMVVQFYWNAEAWLVDPAVMDLDPLTAIAISAISLAVGWFVYDGICRSPLGRNVIVLAVTVFLLILAASYFYTHVFSARSALIHVGAFVGTIMAANVFGIIIPNQKKITASLVAGEAPDPRLGAMGKQRSMHNTYLTLPVLVMMVSGHYPMLTSHPEAWLIVGLILVIGGLGRHFLVRHEVGDGLDKIGWCLPVIAVAFAAAVFVTWPQDRTSSVAAVGDEEILALTQTHCLSCHATNPSHEAFEQPPKNVVLETLDQFRRHKQQIIVQTVQSEIMPLGNETGMTLEERARLGAWLRDN